MTASTYPANLLFSLLQPLPAVLQLHSAQLACKAINHLLNLEPAIQAHLKAHAGRVVLLRWEALPIAPVGATLLASLIAPAGQQAFVITDASSLAVASGSQAATADVTITVLAGIAQAAPEERLRYVRLEGDVLLAQDLSHVAKTLRWDAAHDLSRVIGDTPAYWVVHHAKNAASVLHGAALRMKDNLDNFKPFSHSSSPVNDAVPTQRQP